MYPWYSLCFFNSMIHSWGIITHKSPRDIFFFLLLIGVSHDGGPRDMDRGRTSNNNLWVMRPSKPLMLPRWLASIFAISAVLSFIYHVAGQQTTKTWWFDMRNGTKKTGCLGFWVILFYRDYYKPLWRSRYTAVVVFCYLLFLCWIQCLISFGPFGIPYNNWNPNCCKYI